MGGLVAKDEESYRYLAESIRRFPPQAKFASMIAEAGLEQVKVRNLSGGIAAMHSAWRLEWLPSPVPCAFFIPAGCWPGPPGRFPRVSPLAVCGSLARRDCREP